jgi:hypothetical protein
MQVTSVIDIALWDKADWSGTIFAVAPDSRVPPVLAPAFRVPEIGRKIFERWRTVLGDLDVHELIQITIIEGEIPGQPTGYTVYVGTNPSAATDIASIRLPDLTGPILFTARFHRMTPTPDSPYLSNFKLAYAHSNQFLLAPGIQRGSEWDVMMDLAIEKKQIRFVQAKDLNRGADMEYVVLRRPEDAMPIDLNSTGPDYPPITPTLAVLEAELAAGTVRRYVDPMLADSLADVCYDDDGQVVSESVNPMLLTLAVGVMHDVLERKALSTPLADVQAEYARLLEHFFKQPFAEMTKHNATPNDVAEDLSETPRAVRSINSFAPELHDALIEFWRSNGLTVLAHLRSQSALRAVYGGNLFPHFRSDFISNLALYADTLLLPDPLIQASGMRDFLTEKDLTYFFVRHGLTAMGYKDLALADTAVPIVVFVPDEFWIAESVGKSLHSLSLDDVRLHAEKIFSRQFADVDEVRQLIRSFSNEHELAEAVKDASRFIFDIEENPMPLDQIACLMEDRKKFKGEIGLDDVRSIVSQSLEGRFVQTTHAINRAAMYGGVPVMDAPTSWQYLLWKYEYLAASREPHVDYRDMMVQHVIQSQLADLPALKNLSHEAVIELRRRDSLKELRELLRKGIGAVKNASTETVSEVTRQVRQNLQAAFTEYEEEVRNRAATGSGALKAMGLSGGRLGIALAVVGYGEISWGIAGALAALTGLGTFKDVYHKLREYRTARHKVSQNPVGLFFGVNVRRPARANV